jgi:hypothetical protein
MKRYTVTWSSDDPLCPTVTTWETLTEALESMGDQVLEGFAPDAIYDLDSTIRIEVHVSTPVVTVSEDQLGGGNNPLIPAEDNDETEAEGVSVADVEYFQKALNALRDIHAYLWPELYPVTDSRVSCHPSFTAGEDDVHEWSAETVEIVGQMVLDALENDPATPQGA